MLLMQDMHQPRGLHRMKGECCLMCKELLHAGQLVVLVGMEEVLTILGKITERRNNRVWFLYRKSKTDII